MSKRATEDTLDRMHAEMAKQMLCKLESGEASASDLNVIRQFLKDNDVSGVATQDNPLGKLALNAPTFDEDGPSDYSH